MNRRELLKYQARLCDEANALMSRKNQDYATGNNEQADVFANFRMSQEKTGVPVSTGMLVRLSDKLSRLGQIIRPGYRSKVENETLRDTVLDIINYAVLVAAFEQERQTVPTNGDGTDYDPAKVLLPKDRFCRACD
jgi:hypothetical protein